MYPLVLAGLLALASGITILQVAANPLVVGLGPPERGHFRLTLSQAINSVGTFVGPYVGAVLFLEGLEAGSGARNSQQARAAALVGIDTAFLWIAGLLVALVLFFAAARRLVDAVAVSAKQPIGIGRTIREVISSRWALLGGGAIFLYVGAEVAIGTQMALFLHGDDILAIPLQDAGKLVSFYWGGAMVGRVVGSALLTRVHAPLLLSVATAAACGLCLYILAVGGASAGYAALAIGLCNSIVFPLVFSLTLGRSTASAEATSGFLCFAIVGGAVIPPLVGLVSQHTSYAHAFAVPAVCYGLLCAFAVTSAQTKANTVESEVSMMI
jgi:FHS family L-fucose permease-like MFS transporter